MMPSSAARPPAGHGRGLDAGAVIARLTALTDPAFLAEAGWDPGTRVLSLPSGHRLLGWRACPAGCGNALYNRDGVCGACQRGEARDIAAGPGGQPGEPGGGMRLVPVSGDGLCQVAACGRVPRGNRYCHLHYERFRKRRSGPSFDEREWQAAEPAAERAGQVSLHGLAGRAAAEVLYGLQQRTRSGTRTEPARLRQVARELRAASAARVDDLSGGDRAQHRLVRSLARHVARVFLDPEAERCKDEWDLAAFGYSGWLAFTAIRQRWLRETAKRWAADDLPRRRGRTPAAPVRHYLASLALLSDSLHGSRADHGDDPALLGRTDVESFLHRLAFLTSQGRVSAGSRTRACRETRHLLGQFRLLGLTRPAGPAAGLPGDFTVCSADIPVVPEAPEGGRDLPPEIMRQLCAHLPALEEQSSPETRAAIELMIDTGRRPDEICALAWDCLEYDEPGPGPVLVYGNHKNARQGRRLPIAQPTAGLIVTQKARVRGQFPGTPLSELKLLPAATSNPRGRRPVSPGQIDARHLDWIRGLPALLRADGTEFDKARVIPYAYRHTYAQRHADAGVPVDVLATLMDHRSLNTTRGYYTIGEPRRREAVSKVTALQFDRHGNRIWREAGALPDSAHARRAISEVAVPYGTCSEPSNVQAGGGACPYRFRCIGCGHFRTDVSYLPDLHAYLGDLLRNRERVLAAADIDQWARAEAAPSAEEITRIRQLISRIEGGLGDLEPAEREQVSQAVAIVRRHRTVVLGMPRMRQALPGIRPDRTT